MSDQLPAGIAGAIEAFERAVDATDYSAGPHDRKAARASLEAVILAHLGGGEQDRQPVRVPRLFDVEAEERAWAIWLKRGHGHEGFVACINAYVEDAAASLIADLGRAALAEQGREG